MAVERSNSVESGQTSNTQENLKHLKRILDGLQQLQEIFVFDEKRIQDECNRVVHELVAISVPTLAAHIKEFMNYLNAIGQCLETIIRQSANPELIFINCLQTLYCLLLTKESPSAGSGIIFDIYEQDSIPKAIKLLIKNTANMGVDNDNDFKKVTETLCTWLRSFSGLKNLSICIISFLDGLRDLQKYALLMEIADTVLERLCLSLIIPVVRPNSIKVFSYILCSAQSKTVFFKILPRIFKVFQNIQKDYSKDAPIPPDVQLFIDLMVAFVRRYDLDHSELIAVLKDYTASENVNLLLDAKPWYPPINKRDPSFPIGLVNLGNTCYMNSVLQALFMTKDLTRDILVMKLPSKIINYIQQLISLLLYSVRQELSPHDVLGQRPSNFRYGHQQDSFEYLGFLLDQLHEEEKRCMTAAQLPTTQTNGHAKLTENGDHMDIDENNVLNQTIPMESPPLTDESDDAINPEPSDIVDTMIQKLFGGVMSINYKCLNCCRSSTNVDHFFDLQLSFPQGSESVSSSPTIEKTTYTTQSLINSYFAIEDMVNENQYFCDKCKVHSDAERQVILDDAPTNLILVLKHFKYDRSFHTRRKLLHKVHHDEVVFLNTRRKDGCFRLKYKLYATIVHSGMNIDSGHYYTYAVNEEDEWFKFNDNHISRSSLSEVKSLNSFNTPYILFYELLGEDKIADNAIMYPADMESTAKHPPTNEICRKRKAEPPRWDDLPPKLQDFVNRDNITYVDQYRNKYLSGSNKYHNYYNKHRKSDNDQDPPSDGHCGGSIVEPSNGYIY